MSDVYNPNELYKFENVALDVARTIGNESSQAVDRIKRLINRAATIVGGYDRKWSWLKVVDDTVNTVANDRYVYLPMEVKELLQIWVTGENRQTLDRIPSVEFRRLVPNPEEYTGTPRLYDYEGVDSSGATVLSLYPAPSSVITLGMDYYRHILPIRNDSTNIRSHWGMPPPIIEILISVTAALFWKGIDDERYRQELADAMAEIKEAYGADRNKPGTIIRARADDGNDDLDDGPIYPPRVG